MDTAQDLHSTFCIITTEANSFVAQIHDRMPVILAREDAEDGLNPQLGLDEARAMLSPCPASCIGAYEASSKVHSLAYNEPDLVKPM